MKTVSRDQLEEFGTDVLDELHRLLTRQGNREAAEKLVDLVFVNCPHFVQKVIQRMEKEGSSEAAKKLSVRRHELTRKVAYKYWERRGRPFGSSEVDWSAAEKDIEEGRVRRRQPEPRRD